MNEFYKKLREHKSLQQEHEVPEEAWSKFKAYEQEKEPKAKKRAWFFWPIAAGLIGLVFGGAGVFSYNKVGGVLGGMSTIQHDTVYITKYVEVEKEGALELQNNLTTENIKLQKALESAVAKRKFTERKLNQVALNFESLRSEHEGILADYNRTKNELKAGLVLGTNPQKIEKSNPLDKDQMEDYRNIQETDLLSLKNGLNLLKEKSLFIEPLIVFLPTNKRRKRPISDWIRPKTLSLGAEVGVHIPNQFYGTASPIVVSEAIVVSTLFTPRVRGQFTLGNANFSGEDKDPLANPSFPVIAPVEDGTLKEVKVSRQVFSSSIGLEYIIYKGNKWRPFVGVGIGGERHHYPSFNYEYDTPDGEIYQKLDTELDPEYVINYRANVGIEYYLWKAIDIQVHAEYISSKIYNQSLGLKTRLLYHF